MHRCAAMVLALALIAGCIPSPRDTSPVKDGPKDNRDYFIAIGATVAAVATIGLVAGLVHVVTSKREPYVPEELVERARYAASRPPSFPPP